MSDASSSRGGAVRRIREAADDAINRTRFASKPAQLLDKLFEPSSFPPSLQVRGAKTKRSAGDACRRCIAIEAIAGSTLEAMAGTKSSGRADALIRATLSLGDAGLRGKYVASVARAWPLAALARALDVLCHRAEQAEPTSREALLAVVDALNTDGMEDLVQRLREQAAGGSLLSLERLVRHPGRGLLADPARGSPSGRPPPVHVNRDRGGTLTLGERKALARRPDRETMQRLLADSHPDVIRYCLGNPRLTEDDVVRLAAKRPGRAAVLAEIARSRWVQRPRVRFALALNPLTPLEMTARLVGLLLRPELETVARSPHVPAGVRALCLNHLARRPPFNAPPPPRSEVH